MSAHDPFGAPPPPNSSEAVAALVLGIIGVLFCPLCGPVAWALGRKGERLIDGSYGRLGGRGLATAGKILGMIGTLFVVLLILLVAAGSAALTAAALSSS